MRSLVRSVGYPTCVLSQYKDHRQHKCPELAPDIDLLTRVQKQKKHPGMLDYRPMSVAEKSSV
jgi:hypothetical protein